MRINHNFPDTLLQIAIWHLRQWKILKLSESPNMLNFIQTLIHLIANQWQNNTGLYSWLKLSHLKESREKHRKNVKKNRQGIEQPVVLGSNPWRQLRFFFTFFLCFSLDPFKWESFNLIFMKGQNLIIVIIHLQQHQ